MARNEATLKGLGLLDAVEGLLLGSSARSSTRRGATLVARPRPRPRPRPAMAAPTRVTRSQHGLHSTEDDGALSPIVGASPSPQPSTAPDISEDPRPEEHRSSSPEVTTTGSPAPDPANDLLHSPSLPDEQNGVVAVDLEGCPSWIQEWYGNLTSEKLRNGEQEEWLKTLTNWIALERALKFEKPVSHQPRLYWHLY